MLTGKRPVAAATRERVEAAVRELQYRPNHVARNLRVGTSQMIAVVVPDITNPFYSQLTRGLADALGVDYGTWVCNTDGSAKRERRYLSDVLARGADGLVIASVEPDQDHVLTPIRYNTPMVCLGDSIDHAMVDRVIAADGEGSQAAVAHLLARGARRVATIQGPRGLGLARLAGYEARRSRPPASAPPSSSAYAGTGPGAAAREAMHRLMRLPSRPDAVFCANDLMAIGALDAARELGLRVPDDIRHRRLRRHRGRRRWSARR